MQEQRTDAVLVSEWREILRAMRGSTTAASWSDVADRLAKIETAQMLAGWRADMDTTAA